MKRVAKFAIRTACLILSLAAAAAVGGARAGASANAAVAASARAGANAAVAESPQASASANAAGAASARANPGDSANAANADTPQASASAASEMEIAASFLVRKGIYTSGWSGELGLGESLSRAELAAIMTLLDFSGAPGGIEEWRKWGAAHFSDPENRVSKFSDLSPWALPYVEYCYQRNLMKGVLESKFDPQGVVTPHMACAVILRYCEIAETGWDYGMSVAKAHSLGLAPDEGLGGSGTLRGTMAVMLYRAICYMDAASGRQSAGAAAAGAASAPSLGAAPSPGAESAAKNGAAPSPGAESAAPAKSVPGAGDAVPAKSIDEMKAEIVRLTNAERAKAGLPELKILPELMKCAQAKAQDMLDNEYYGHTSPVYGPAADMIFKFVPNATTAAENIAAWAKTPQIAFDLWMGSEKGHRENLLAERLTHIGVGIVEEADGVYWWVQQFVKL